MKTETRSTTISYQVVGRSIHFPKSWTQLECGSNDYISCHYYDREHTLVLSMNRQHGYIGAEIINRNNGEVWGSVFFQNASEELRPNIFDLTECTIADIVSEYIYY